MRGQHGNEGSKLLLQPKAVHPELWLNFFRTWINLYKKYLNQPMAPFPPHSVGCLASSFQNISSNYLEQIASSINETVPVIQRLLFYACLIMIDKTRLLHYKKMFMFIYFLYLLYITICKKEIFSSINSQSQVLNQR